MDSNNPQNNAPAVAGAITFPSRSQDVHPAPVQPRQPRNLQGLLRFAMEATKAEDAPGDSTLGPMDEERRKFLEEALKSLTVDIAEVLHTSITTLTDAEKMKSIQLGQPLPEDVQSAFNNLLEYIDDIDVANDFYKMGGFAIFPIAYGSENDEIRALASTVLAEVCQNNPCCQARALECGILNVLLNLVQSERGQALTKCLYAISCASREYSPACRELTAQGGCDTLAELVATPEPAARTKVAFLIRYLCHHYREAKEQFIKLNLVKIIAEQIKKGRDATTEHLLSTLLALVDGPDPVVLAQCRDPSVGLRNILEDLLKHPDLIGERFREERDYCQELLKQVFTDCAQVEPMDDVVADR
ncbi:hsp70-binding protein 1 [Pectinophora gossypiella]|uniref:hsp70-binding protein 1 n=1 Tax=Pectinophora gossypiella TaxID=13191 RepID=UPI00214DF310|nr:hsp70-binding protein 1 [Pectinophora gossypiella]